MFVFEMDSVSYFHEAVGTAASQTEAAHARAWIGYSGTPTVVECTQCHAVSSVLTESAPELVSHRHY